MNAPSLPIKVVGVVDVPIYTIRAADYLPVRDVLSVWQRLLARVGLRSPAGRVVVLQPGNVLLTHPDNVAAVAAWLRRRGHSVRLMNVRLVE